MTPKVQGPHSQLAQALLGLDTWRWGGWQAIVTRKGSWCATWQFPQEPNAQKVPRKRRDSQRTFSHVWDRPRASPPRLPPTPLLSHFHSSTILLGKDEALKKKSGNTTEHDKLRCSLAPGQAVGTWRSAPDMREPVGVSAGHSGAHGNLAVSAGHEGDRGTSGDRPENTWS